MQAVETETTAAMAEQLPHQPLQGDGLAHRVALDQNAEFGAVHITTEQRPTAALIHLLQLRETTALQIELQLMGQLGALGAAPAVAGLTEGEHHSLHGTAAQAAGDLAREHLG